MNPPEEAENMNQPDPQAVDDAAVSTTTLTETTVISLLGFPCFLLRLLMSFFQCFLQKECVVCAFTQLNTTMWVTSEGGVQKEAGALGKMAAALREIAPELRNCSNLVSVGGAGAGDGSKDVGSAPSQNNIHVVDLSGGPNSDNVGTAGWPQDAALSFPLGLISKWMNDTIMMGNMIHVDNEGGGHVLVNPNPTLAEGSSFGEVSLPLSMRLGEDCSADGSQPGGRRRSGLKGKLIEQSPEEAKRSGKLRRSSREPTWEVYGTKTVGVTFPSFIKCKFKLTERYKYILETSQTIAYIFANKLNAHEVLFKRGHRQMDREDFATLLPGNEPSDYVMELMAFKIAWTMSQIQARTLWSLPSLFSVRFLALFLHFIT
ncbi:hypothetical protein PIB30_012242 [Stylosanthes scabra]|uniref:Uncharacterized protein n=1 Tax=Stylosanthes scabra TaxID=79078 RepID=A0ABU6V7P2_9FABA|nr:hypothetical protein [Stylosanthes scabra]